MLRGYRLVRSTFTSVCDELLIVMSYENEVNMGLDVASVKGDEVGQKS